MFFSVYAAILLSLPNTHLFTLKNLKKSPHSKCRSQIYSFIYYNYMLAHYLARPTYDYSTGAIIYVKHPG